MFGAGKANRKRNENKQIVRNVHALAFRVEQRERGPATGQPKTAAKDSRARTPLVLNHSRNYIFLSPALPTLPLIRQVKEIHRAHSSAHMCSLLALIASVGGKCSSCKTVERVPLCFLSSALLSLRHFVPALPLHLSFSRARQRSQPNEKKLPHAIDFKQRGS